jgi:hypothetical protein
MFSSSMEMVFGILLLVMVLSPVSDVYHIMFIVPYIALVSVMACRVFREVKLGYIKDTKLQMVGCVWNRDRLMTY